MLKRLLTAILVLTSAVFTVTAAQAKEQYAVSMAIGAPGSESFVFGTELWAMSQIALKPQHGIDLVALKVPDENELLGLLRDAGVDVALVQGEVSISDGNDMRTVMMLWSDGGSTGAAEPAQLLARKDVADDVIYRITKAIFENTNFFSVTKERFGAADLIQAVVGADLPIHPGASRYYQESGVASNAALGDLVAQVRTGAHADAVELRGKLEATTTFHNFDDTALNDEERAQVAAACRQALDLGALSAVLGDLSTRGCEVYQSYLEEQENARRQQAAVNADLFALPSGQGGPAIALDDIDSDRDAPMVMIDHYTLKRRAPLKPTM